MNLGLDFGAPLSMDIDPWHMDMAHVQPYLVSRRVHKAAIHATVSRDDAHLTSAFLYPRAPAAAAPLSLQLRQFLGRPAREPPM